ncbi:hypothetical protein SLEP1_g40506 [Rubroshorea leprosula]|uniref:Chlorophyll a-b binding protein, chloroplastic n=1 Tax=Rubroshorea leprosula TaxID=152421 RepID=A0AAV5L3L6_9ROSI|nr:hypothetical protein SLEP1_g40506 [Rubroshorea leprosula]
MTSIAQNLPQGVTFFDSPPADIHGILSSDDVGTLFPLEFELCYFSFLWIKRVEFFNLTKWKGDGYYGPLPELLSAEKPAIYCNFTQQEFLENFYGKGLDGKSLFDKITIQG